jgi:hypothetical protein
MNFVALDLEDQITEMETGEGTPNTNLEYLGIGDSMIAEPKPVAGIFCRLFPKLRKVFHSPSRRAEGWSVVNNSLGQQLGP